VCYGNTSNLIGIVRAGHSISSPIKTSANLCFPCAAEQRIEQRKYLRVLYEREYGDELEARTFSGTEDVYHVRGTYYPKNSYAKTRRAAFEIAGELTELLEEYIDTYSCQIHNEGSQSWWIFDDRAATTPAAVSGLIGAP
jgi:hypothetical protein